MPSFSFTLDYTQASALRDLLSIGHIPGDVTLSHFCEELSRYLDAMDDYSAQVALTASHPEFSF